MKWPRTPLGEFWRCAGPNYTNPAVRPNRSSFFLLAMVSLLSRKSARKNFWAEYIRPIERLAARDFTV